MLLNLLLTSLTSTTPTCVGPTTADSLLSIVPADAYVLVHGQDLAGLRARAERNDWYRLLGSENGELFLDDLERELRHSAHSDMDSLLGIASELDAEVVFFDTGSVAGFVAEPGTDRAALTERMRAWLPTGDEALERTLELPGGSAQLVAWPEQLHDGWTGRAGHYAAFVDHPGAVALYSGDDAAAVVAAVTDGFNGLLTGRSAPLVQAYRNAGGGQSGAIEVYLDFTPLVDDAEAELKKALEGSLPDPTGLLGLEEGTWFHASFDVFPGSRIAANGRLNLPTGTLIADLADTFTALPRTLPAELPNGAWFLWSLSWDIKEFYARARAAAEEAGRGEGLAQLDATVEMSQQMTQVDPIEDVLNQLSGEFSFFHVEPETGQETEPHMRAWITAGLNVGLVDGHDLVAVFEKAMDVGGLHSFVELEDIGGVDAYVVREDPEGGGVAILPHAMTVGIQRGVLESAVAALAGQDGASVAPGSLMQGTIDQHAGDCFLFNVEMTPLRAYWLPDLEDTGLPPLADGQPIRDPFDSQFVASARRTADGFTFRIETR